MNEPLRKVVRVRCSVDHAFETFTRRMDLWWPKGHRKFDESELGIEANVGGRFFERASDGEEAELGRVVRWEPPHRLTYTWRPGSVTGPTEVDVTFQAEGELTRVEVTHSEGQSALGDLWRERVAKFDSSWERVLAAWSEWLERRSEEESSNR